LVYKGYQCEHLRQGEI